jgi:hypothetical protein
MNQGWIHTDTKNDISDNENATSATKYIPSQMYYLNDSTTTTDNNSNSSTNNTTTTFSGIILFPIVHGNNNNDDFVAMIVAEIDRKQLIFDQLDRVLPSSFSSFISALSLSCDIVSVQLQNTCGHSYTFNRHTDTGEIDYIGKNCHTWMIMMAMIITVTITIIITKVLHLNWVIIKIGMIRKVIVTTM